MSDAVLVINAGSSSLKFSVYRLNGTDDLDLDCKGQIEGIGVHPHFTAKSASGDSLADKTWDPVTDGGGHNTAFEVLAKWLRDYLGDDAVRAVGHRVVHGGTHYDDAVVVNLGVMARLETLNPLAPLHQPNNLSAIKAVATAEPDIPQVACFDTAFHRHHAKVAELFALPQEFYDEGVRRYGFHGLSYEYIARALAERAPDLAKGRVVVAHLGSGASMCAIKDGRSVDSTMGFTALDGLCMGTRCGAIDPGVLLYLMQEKSMDAKQIEDLLYKRTGLLGISGISNDLRDLLESNAPQAAEAIDYFVYRITKELGALTATLGGLDCLVFTAGIGERSPLIRERVVHDGAWLGLTLDEAANRNGDGRISRAGEAPEVWVIPTDEEKMIALHTVRAIGA